MIDKEKTLGIWVKEFAGDLYQWAHYKTSTTAEAEDLVQDTFLAALEEMESFRGESTPKTWLFSILNHKIMDYYRKKVTQTGKTNETSTITMFFNEMGEWNAMARPHDWQNDDANLLDDHQFQAILARCLEALPDKWSTCVKLKYLSDKSGEEICQEIGINTTNYWQIVHRAKLQLRNCVENEWFKK
jgi:RNA polymerase sigma-70 factor (ECF subfamily)